MKQARVIDPELAAKLRKLRESKEIKPLRGTPLLADKIQTSAGEIPFALRSYQIQGVLHLMLTTNFVLGDDTGTGKTAMSIAALCYLWETDPDRKVLILTTKSATGQWAEEFAKFTTGGVHVFVSRGTPKKRKEIYDSFVASMGPTVLIMNYALARTDFDRLQKWQNFVFIPDECTAFKNPQTQAHKVCKFLSNQAHRTWGLTATLIKNRLIEGYGIYRVVAPWIFPMSKTDFMLNFSNTQMQRVAGGRQVLVTTGYTPEHIDNFRAKIQDYFLGRAKHEVAADLPTLTCRQIDVGMSAAQEAMYAEALEGLLVVREEEKEVSKLTALIYMQQIVNHPGLIEREGTSHKFDALLELLGDGDLSDEKVIIFTRFRKMVDLIVPALNKLRGKDFCVRITGAELNVKDRQKAQAMFQDPESKTQAICITMAGSDAINLQAAKAIVFYDSPYSAGDYLQILGRMIRIGSMHDNVYAIHFLSGETIDRQVMEILLRKMSLIEGVLGKKLKGEGEADFHIPEESDTKLIFQALRTQALKRKKG